MHTIAQAAQVTGKNRSTLLRAIKTGKLSAHKQDDGSYLIDSSELFRVYDAQGALVQMHQPAQATHNSAQGTQNELIEALREQIELLRNQGAGASGSLAQSGRHAIDAPARNTQGRARQSG
jgi:hypothetical protein